MFWALLNGSYTASQPSLFPTLPAQRLGVCSQDRCPQLTRGIFHTP